MQRELSDQQQAKRALILNWATIPLYVGALVVLAFWLPTSIWERVFLIVAALCLAGVLAFVPWVKYRRLVGRPTRFDKVVPPL